MGEKEFTKILDLYGLDRLRMRIVTESGKVTYTMVQYETFVQDEWHAVVRYDNSHGYPHRDVLHPNGEEDKFPLRFADLSTFVLYAEQDLRDRWPWYKERFLQEMKER